MGNMNKAVVLVLHLQNLSLNQVVIEESVDIKSPTAGVRPKKKKSYDLNPTDKFWQAEQVSQFPTVAEAVREELESYRAREDDMSSGYCEEQATLDTSKFFRDDPNIPGVIGVFVFYGVIFLVGILSTWYGYRKRKRDGKNTSEKEHVMLADRSLGVFVGICTLTASKVSGSSINGTVEQVFNVAGGGLAWVLAPFWFQLSDIFAIPFAIKLKKMGSTTVLDMFEIRYGRVHTCFLFCVFALNDILLAGSTLAALGASFSVIIGVNYTWAVIISAGVSTLYTFIGGLYSVTYTDIVQMVFIIIGTYLALPFAWMNDAVTNIAETAKFDPSWLGSIQPDSLGIYLDVALLMALGGIPWPLFYQRVFALKSGSCGVASLILVSILLFFVMLVPSVLLGAIAASTDWNQTSYRDFGEIPVPDCDIKLGLPMVMRFLTPVPVGVIGLGAVCAAVMSSIDSLTLNTSTLFANNVYVPIRNSIAQCCCKSPTKASDCEVIWMMRIAVVIMGVLITVVAIRATSIYGVFAVSADLSYCAVFPQFLCAVYIPFTNLWGASFGFWIAVILRFLSGEPMFDLPTVMKFPLFDEESQTQFFPFRTLIMLINLIVILVVSAIARACCGTDNPRCCTTYNMNTTTASDASFLKPQDHLDTDETEERDLTDLKSATEINGVNKPSRVDNGYTNPSFYSDYEIDQNDRL